MDPANNRVLVNGEPSSVLSCGAKIPAPPETATQANVQRLALETLIPEGAELGCHVIDFEEAQIGCSLPSIQLPSTEAMVQSCKSWGRWGMAVGAASWRRGTEAVTGALEALAAGELNPRLTDLSERLVHLPTGLNEREIYLAVLEKDLTGIRQEYEDFGDDAQRVEELERVIQEAKSSLQKEREELTEAQNAIEKIQKGTVGYAEAVSVSEILEKLTETAETKPFIEMTRKWLGEIQEKGL